jgi:hypothetical protein
MVVSSDGLNHQAARIAQFDCETLQPTDKFGSQTASHSFGIGSGVCDGKFVHVDLGDNYPRGIICHFDGEDKVVYNFKTLHGQDEKNMAGAPFPKYTEASKNGKNFWQWSNDNNTYTELAAPAYVDCADGLGFFFLGECPALDNGCAGAQYHNSPR